ncbi:MAG: DUF1348 family protein [Gammaproteobacteria bacterium]
MTPEEIVQFAEDQHATGRVEAMMECFEDNVEAYWNGRQIASNKAGLEAWYHGFFDGLESFQLKKTLRAASGNVLAVEWVHRRTDAEGKTFDGFAAEVWWLSEKNRLTRWHAHCTEYEVGAPDGA